ncbi:MAG: DUF1194 domain-containing protein [Gemmobacter sp.]
MLRPFALALALIARPAMGCEVALVLAMDVSGSIDAGEYRLQVEGLTAALADGAVRDVMLRGQVALTVVQWSGLGQQQQSIPWRRMLSEAGIDRFRHEVSIMPRAWLRGETGVGEAIAFAAALFPEVADCERKVIDLSGDGAENVGFGTPRARREAIAAGIEINALAIERIGVAITNFYRGWVISPGGFVVTASGHLDYARAIRIKILRELSAPVG